MTLAIFILPANISLAQDDVYDNPRPKQSKAKKTYTEPTEQSEKKNTAEISQPYTESEQTTTRIADKNFIADNYSDNYTDYNDGYDSDWNYSYTDRIRRFHNPSFQFNYGWNNWNNNYYNPWNSYNNNFGWNNWDNYSFTPSWYHSYANFYNPFNSTQIIIIQPGFGYSSWYNTGYNNPWNAWNNFGWNSWNNNWYGFSPYCSNAIYNNSYYHHYGINENYYNKRNVVNTPRTGGYNNTGNVQSGNGNYNQYNNNPSNTNNGKGGFNDNSSNTNTQQVTKTTKWNTKQSNPSTNTPNENVYKYAQPNNHSNNSWNNTPSYNNNSYEREKINTNDGNSGIKIGTRSK